MKIENLLKLSTDDLFEIIGEEIITSESMLPFDKNQYILLAKKWFETKKIEIISVLCEKKVRKYLGKIDSKVILVSTIIDIITPLLMGIPVAVVSVLIVKEGIDTLCNK